MRKILSLCLVLVLILSMTPAAFAAVWGCASCGNEGLATCPVCDTSYCPDCGFNACACNATLSSNGTQVEYNADDRDGDGQLDNLAYTITVPALLAPGGSGTVTLQGMWPSNATVKVTADPSVEMVNSINSADKKTLAVTFTAIELAGNNTAAVSDDETVSVADISNALFGTWSGKFNYNVDYVAGSGNTGSGTTGGESGGTTVEPGEGQISFNLLYNDTVYTYLADENMTWEAWIASDYNTINTVVFRQGVHFQEAGATLVMEASYLYTDAEGTEDGYVYVTDEIQTGTTYYVVSVDDNGWYLGKT